MDLKRTRRLLEEAYSDYRLCRLMKLTNRTEYALLALIYLARRVRQVGPGYVHADEISEAQNVPKRFLQQILHALKRARLVHSVKGKDGGYALAKPAEKITVAEVVRLFDGALAPSRSVSKYFYEPTPIEKERGMLVLLKEIRKMVADKLETVTLDQVSR